MELNIIVIRCWSLYLPAGNVTIWLESRVKKIHLKKSVWRALIGLRQKIFLNYFI